MNEAASMTESHTSTALEAARTRMFGLMLEIAVAFAVPAVIGAVIGRKLDAAQNTGFTYTISLLALTFVLSWIFVIVRYRQAHAALVAAKKSVHEQNSVAAELTPKN